MWPGISAGGTCHLVVTVPKSSPLRRLLKITNFQEVAPICDDAETAVELIAKGLGEGGTGGS